MKKYVVLQPLHGETLDVLLEMDLLQVKKPLQAILSQKPRREMPMCGFWLGHALQRKGEMMVAYLVSKIFFHDMICYSKNREVG